MKKQEIKGKFIICFDTICEGLQCAKDENENPDPTLFDSEADALLELFADAISGLKGTTDDYFVENNLDKEKVVAEMTEILKSKDTIKMKDYLEQNPSCNYYDEMIEKAEDFILGRKAIFTGQGIVIDGVKLEEL